MCIQVYIYIVIIWMIHLKNGSTIFGKEKMKEKEAVDNELCLCLSYIQDTSYTVLDTKFQRDGVGIWAREKDIVFYM